MQMEEGIARSENEICECIGGVLKHKFNNCLKQYRHHLSSKPYFQRLFVSLSPNDILGRVCDKLAAEKSMERKHKMLLRNTASSYIDSIKSVLDGRPPTTLCAVGLTAAIASMTWGSMKPRRVDVALACDIKLGTLNKAIKVVVESKHSFPVLD
jgi:transcription initiation factor TFIIIB Brf1 subunit/transcription initiation factor TFIIB